MDIEFHYWITGLIASRAGFTDDEAYTIAYSSQYVDENDISYTIVDRRDNSKYINFVSQTMNILKPKDTLMRIYPIFHFVPGDPMAPSARRRDGKMHVLNTTPDNANANAMIDAAFAAPEYTRLFRIGIASHVYVDTWAHQNFVGWYDHFNNLDVSPTPLIGHMGAGHHPDWINHSWTDNRLVDGEVSNRARHLAASCALFRKYCKFLKGIGRSDKTDAWPKLQDELITMMGQSYTGDVIRYEDARAKSYGQRLKWHAFDEEAWFNEAIHTEVSGARDSAHDLLSLVTLFHDRYWWREGVTKETSSWYRFQEAVKEHEAFGIPQLSGIFRDMGYDLAAV